MGCRRLGLNLIAVVSINGLLAKSEPASLFAGPVSHQLTGLNHAIEKTESWLHNDGILTTVITLKPQKPKKVGPVNVALVQSEPAMVEYANDYVPATMRKDVVQDRFWNALRERLEFDKTAKTNSTLGKKIIVASYKPVPEPQLPTDVVEPYLPTDESSDDILSPQERKELDEFNQSLAPQSRIQQMPYAPLNPQDHAMTLAMQMQMSAQALSNQATALMMSNQRAYAPVNYQQMPALQVAHTQPTSQPASVFQTSTISHELVSPALPRQEKMSRLMSMLNQIMMSGVYSMQRLLVLIDLEIDIIERLLARETGSRLEKIVAERNKTLTQSAPMVVSAYDAIIDLATTDAYGESDSRLYHYFVRSGKKEKITQSSKKKFLLAMMYAIKHYQEMIESMYNISRTALPSR